MRTGKPAAPAREAMAAVIRRHLAAYGPASRETFARWFGMPSAAQAGKLIAALGDEVAPVSVEGWEGWMLRDDVADAARGAPSGVVVAAAGVRPVRRRGAARGDAGAGGRSTRTASTAARAGCRRCCSSTGASPASGATRARAAWLGVTIEPFAAVDDAVRAGAEREAQRLAEYFGDELELAWE